VRKKKIEYEKERESDENRKSGCEKEGESE